MAINEADALAREYVLVFSQEEHSGPVVLLGVGETNAYMTPEGKWQAQAIPARLRTYPFILVATEKPGQMIVARDANAEHFKGQAGQALFDAQGKPAELLQQITSLLMAMHNEFQEAQALTRQLEDAGLIDERRVDIQLKDGTYRHFAGFKAVVEDKLAALDDATRKELEHSGAMKLLQLHQASLNNFARLVNS